VRPDQIDLMDLDPFVRAADGELFRVLRDCDPCHWNEEPDGGAGFWSLTRYADVKSAGSDWETFSSAGGTQIQSRRAEGHGKPSIHNMDAPRHRDMRALVAAEFTRERMLRLEPRIRELVSRHLDELVAQGEADLVSAATARIPVLVLGALLGVDPDHATRLISWTNVMSGQTDPDYVADPDFVAQTRTEIFDYFHELTEQRRARPGEDLISLLSHASIDNIPLDQEELDAYYLVMLVAGNETTRNLMTGTVLLMHENPAQWARLKEGQVTAKVAVEELVRMISPIVCMRRTATRDVQLHDRRIKAGQKVVLWFTSANRDERVFDQPDRLILDRSPNKHLGFGWGPHFCIGSHLAKIEAEILLEELLKRDIVLAVTGAPVRLRSNFFRGIKKLPVKVA
jgi:cytochrome P450